MSDGAAEKELEFWRDGKLGKSGARRNAQPAVLFGQVREDAEVEVSCSVPSNRKQSKMFLPSHLVAVRHCR